MLKGVKEQHLPQTGGLAFFTFESHLKILSFDFAGTDPEILHWINPERVVDFGFAFAH